MQLNWIFWWDAIELEDRCMAPVSYFARNPQWTCVHFVVWLYEIGSVGCDLFMASSAGRWQKAGRKGSKIKKGRMQNNVRKNEASSGLIVLRSIASVAVAAMLSV